MSFTPDVGQAIRQVMYWLSLALTVAVFVGSLIWQDRMILWIMLGIAAGLLILRSVWLSVISFRKRRDARWQQPLTVTSMTSEDDLFKI